MKNLRLLGTSALGSAAFIGATVALAAPAAAQTAPAPQPTTNSQQQAQPGSQPGDTKNPNAVNPQSEVEVESGKPAAQAAAPGEEPSIVVTGSRIRRPNLTSPVPITSVTAEELPNMSQASIGDALNDLPAIRSTFSQQNSGRFIGTAGLNELDLRGLGTTRTLVLVNGRRHVTAVPGSFIVDVNTIPQDLVDRIDVVTGGEAAIYGSDAVAGVVNFVLKRNFDGFRIRAQDGISSHGDRGVAFVTATAGRNFADSRGNIAVSLEYTHAAPLYFRERPEFTGAYTGRCQFQLVQNTAAEAATPTNSDNVPDRIFLCGIRNAAISNGGTVGQINAAGDYLRFDNAGALYIDHPTQSFRPVGSGNQQGGDGSTLRDTGQLAVGQDRYVANLLAHFDIVSGLRYFIEAKFVHQDVEQEGQPSFMQNSFRSFFGPGADNSTRNLSCGNAFLTAQNIATLRQFGLCATPTGTFNIARFNVDFGGRRETDRRNTFRIVSGFEGDFNNGWHYEVSANYGRFDAKNIERNDLRLFDLNGNPDGFLLAADAVRNAQGQIVCRVNQTTVTRPDCVPINFFGGYQPSQAALNFVNTTSYLYSHATELDLLAFVSGDTKNWFSLPGGPIGFSVGAEYRRETAHRHADPLSASGGTFFNAFKRFDPPAFEVKEAFGELNLPLLKDVPFFHELSVTGAARYSDYNTSAKHTWAWNVSGVWSPVSDLRLRANYSKSVRVPTLSDLYSPASQNFGFVADPCDIQNIGIGNNRANCAAAGVPSTILAGSPCVTPATPVGSPFINCVARAQTIGFLSGGNPGLTAETGKSLTVGGVITPRFMPGFSLSIDYFDIVVENLIATLGAQQILNLCYNQASINNQYCALINPRDQFGLFQTPALLSSGVNFARQTSRGVDFDLAYRHTFANGYRLNVRGIATWTRVRNNFTDPTNPLRASRQLSNLGDPEFAANLNLGIGKGPWDLNYSLRYIGRQIVSVGTYETFFPFQGRPAQDPDAAERIWYPVVLYHDLRGSYKVNNRFRMYLGIDNVFDKKPPLDLLGTEGGSPYSSIGRYFYAGVQVDF